MVWQEAQGTLTTPEPFPTTVQNEPQQVTSNMGAAAAFMASAFLEEPCTELVSQRIVFDEHRCFSVWNPSAAAL